MTSLLNSISITNFKGFSEAVHLELKPVTLLFGANSAGKSSVLHALQYVREILERNNTNADHTLQGGSAVDLGGFLNVVNGRDQTKRIEIEVGMVLGDNAIPELVPEAFEEWHTSDTDVWKFYDLLQGVRKKVDSVTVRLIVGWNERREAPFVVGYEVGTNGEWCVKVEASIDGRDTSMRINSENPIFLSEQSDDDALQWDLLDWVSVDDLGKTSSDGPNEDTGSETVAPPESKMASIWGDVIYAVKESGMERPGDGLRAWLTGFSGALPKLGQMLFIPAPGATGASNVYIAREFTAFLSWLTIGPAMLLMEQLRELRYVGPLRTIPPRGLDANLSKNEGAWSDGMAAWQTLLSGTQRLVNECSDWMSDPEKLGTGYSVRRLRLQEFDLSSQEPRPIGRVRSRVVLVDAVGAEYQPQDVGVGISQVLPVVVAAQDASASLVCIEQPELHVHPAIQVGLGDLFINGVLDHELTFLLETHSEHLILRLLRRIREAAEHASDAIGTKVKPEMVAVYCLSKVDGHIVADLIPVNDQGDFDKPWPKGFFEERGAELF